MNKQSFSRSSVKLKHKIMFHTRLLDIGTRSKFFATQKVANSIQRIYVINLDRNPNRWSQISRELNRIRSSSDEPLFSIARRFSAVDARYIDKETDSNVLRTEYSLADQLLVEPNPRVRVNAKSQTHRIHMTPQEIAIALSHIKVWKLIASSNVQYTLVLEDDVYFRRNFSRSFDKLWISTINQKLTKSAFDLLYLSFQEVGAPPSSKRQSANLVHKPNCGMWQASGYVLSQQGAKKLIKLLPAYGPIDLWLNLQFKKLDILVAKRPIIEQRLDVPSTNSYSVMPVLSKVGIYNFEKPLVAQSKNLLGPVFAYGSPGTGLTSLAKALSILGYTCCSDATNLPTVEQDNLFTRRRNNIFNAYVNIGSVSNKLFTELVKIYPKARFIFTTNPNYKIPTAIRSRAIYLPYKYLDKWAILSKFLECEYPVFLYPICDDIGQRSMTSVSNAENILPFRRLKFDSSPWIVSSKGWRGLIVNEAEQNADFESEQAILTGKSGINDSYWKLRDDTFPSNLTLFTPNNVKINKSGVVILSLKKQDSLVRSFTSGAIVTRKRYLYGRFSVKIRPSNVNGLITGIFLHRNSPHQEIDIEFLGKDTTKMLINVFYNPGIEGTKLEYGYRGTPTLIELGFDAAKEFHEYEIEWRADEIYWRIDGKIIHRRVLWDPTPIPDLPMEFNINLWCSRSRELASDLDLSRVPSTVEIKSTQIMQNKKRIFKRV